MKHQQVPIDNINKNIKNIKNIKNKKPKYG